VTTTDPEATFYQTIEEFFVSRRGDPLTLSNADWTLMRTWRRAGIPLRVVLRGIADALDAHAHSWSRKEKVGSLRYCAAEVEVARERWEHALGGGGGAGEALERFERVLREAPGLGPRARVVALEVAEACAGLAGEGTREVESFLQASETRLLKALAEDAGPEAREALEAALESTLAPYQGRLPPKILDQVRRDGRARRWLEAKGLPRLSLFHLS
jgi:hypothetical protein